MLCYKFEIISFCSFYFGTEVNILTTVNLFSFMSIILLQKSYSVFSEALIYNTFDESFVYAIFVVLVI